MVLKVVDEMRKQKLSMLSGKNSNNRLGDLVPEPSSLAKALLDKASRNLGKAGARLLVGMVFVR